MLCFFLPLIKKAKEHERKLKGELVYEEELQGIKSSVRVQARLTKGRVRKGVLGVVLFLPYVQLEADVPSEHLFHGHLGVLLESSPRFTLLL